MAAKRLILFPLAIILLVIGNGQALPSNSRIWGGSDATSGQYAHVVSVRVNGAHTCGGTIVAQKHILTAGHCVSQTGSTPVNSSTVSIRVGSGNQYAGGQIVDVAGINIHPSYGNFLNDLAIVTLKEPLTFSDKINKITLADKDDVAEENTPVSVMGWGVQESGASPYKLQHVAMSVLSQSNCELQVGYGYESCICLQHPVNTGFCRGDYGAGVVSNSKLIGVASFSFGSCGTKYPDISSKIAYYREWIDGIIA